MKRHCILYINILGRYCAHNLPLVETQRELNQLAKDFINLIDGIFMDIVPKSQDEVIIQDFLDSIEKNG